MLADGAKFCYLAAVLRQTCGEYLLYPVRYYHELQDLFFSGIIDHINKIK